MTTLKQIPAPDLTAVLEEAKDDLKYRLNAVQVGIIQDFNASEQTATVRMAIKQVQDVTPDGTKIYVEFPLLKKVPVWVYGAGGFSLTFPVAAGDECLVLFNDRQIDNWWLNGGVQPPVMSRAHDISDAIAVVGLRSLPRSLGGYSTSTTQLRSDDGTTYVEVAGGGIVNVVAPTQINLDTPIVHITGIVNIDNENAETSACNIEGDIRVNGDVVGDSSGAEISLNHHVHDGVQTGGGNTGEPVG
jgi:hypothetical protein